jgi:hypothetical protein
MQGRIDVESQEGIGTRFIVRLPMAAAHAEGRIMVDRPKLLIVEDDPGLQAQLKWAYDDFEVIVVGDRESALAALRAHEPAVVTLDLGLPPIPMARPRALPRWTRSWRSSPIPR